MAAATSPERRDGDASNLIVCGVTNRARRPRRAATMLDPKRIFPSLLVAMALAVSGCTDELPPYGEVLLVVDTDVPAKLAEQLRVDVYADDGRWIESRRVARPDERDWPASFSIVAPSEDPLTEVLVRLRAHPTARVRDYRGERFEPRPTFVPIVVPRTLTEACEAPPRIELGRTHWVRGGRAPFIDGLAAGNCAPWPTEAGAGVLQVEVPEAGTYRFAVLSTMPPFDLQISLEIRRACDDSSTAIGCEAGLEWDPDVNDMVGTGGPLGYLPQLDVSLEAGTHYVFVTTGGTSIGTTLAPFEVQVAAAAIDRWDELESATDDAPWDWSSTEPEAPADPLMVSDGPTPADEPLPEVTIDRLVRLELEYGIVRTANVTLHGACFGTMAMLRSDSSRQAPVLDEAMSCIDTEGQREPVVPTAAGDGLVVPTSSQVGTFPEPEPCDQTATSRAVCVPGGVFIMGSRSDALTTEMLRSAQPERIAIMSPFWIDRREVTVERWRAALARGFVPPSEEDAPYANDGPYATTDEEGEFDDPAARCTYSTSPMGREQWPVNCVSWWAARALCQFDGGDLPSAAQWEYVATAAGRDYETRFPWGDDAPVCSPADCEGDGPCHSAVLLRTSTATRSCLHAGFGATEVLAFEDSVHGDVSVPLNPDPDAVVFGLVGNVGEFVLDSFHPYAAPCWRGAALRDPICWEEEAPVRNRRGSSWLGGLMSGQGASRNWVRGAAKPRYPSFPNPLDHIGFRCVYAAVPEVP